MQYTVVWPRTWTDIDATTDWLTRHPLVRQVVLICPDGKAPSASKVEVLNGTRPFSGETVSRALQAARGDLILWFAPETRCQPNPHALERFADVAAASGAHWLYSDYVEQRDGKLVPHPTIDYQLGSVRDAFDFGPLVVVDRAAALRAIDTAGPLTPGDGAGLYELRLKMSQERLPLRIPEPLYTVVPVDARTASEKHFDYVDPRNEQRQRAFEVVFTDHLRRIGAYVAPEFAPPPPPGEAFPVTASVIVPVRNRERTIGDAVRSILAQKTRFAFNTIIVDNHSTDGTTAMLHELAARHANVRHLVPETTDLGIGGCWNHAVCSEHCGRYAVQLDSDDIYPDETVLQRVVDCFEAGPYAMVVGAYRLVNMDLVEIPPGVIDHREWTRENGHNNLLRVNGIGAPRAFDTSVYRRILLPNVSYGEDYAMALRISREYEVGRIYDPIYLCRRWEDNTDASLPLDVANRYDTYKDRLRTIEILARQQRNRR